MLYPAELRGLRLNFSTFLQFCRGAVWCRTPECDTHAGGSHVGDPHPTTPLWLQGTALASWHGAMVKKIRRRFHDFGENLQDALRKYDEQKAMREAGVIRREPAATFADDRHRGSCLQCRPCIPGRKSRGGRVCPPAGLEMRSERRGSSNAWGHRSPAFSGGRATR
jgi:hypothetical protein